MRWKDCVKRDVRKAGEEEDWKKKTTYRGEWKRLTDEALKKLRAAPTPDKGNKRTREISYTVSTNNQSSCPVLRHVLATLSRHMWTFDQFYSCIKN